jgi:hypothetical protein
MAKKPLYATRRIEHGALVNGKNVVSVFEAGEPVKGLSDDDIAALGTAVTEDALAKAGDSADDADAKAKAEADALAAANAGKA